MPTTKWQAHICTEMPNSIQGKRRPTTHLHRATTWGAHQTSSASLLWFQHGKDINMAKKIMVVFFILPW
jgi:hypothetical protein